MWYPYTTHSKASQWQHWFGGDVCLMIIPPTSSVVIGWLFLLDRWFTAATIIVFHELHIHIPPHSQLTLCLLISTESPAQDALSKLCVYHITHAKANDITSQDLLLHLWLFSMLHCYMPYKDKELEIELCGSGIASANYKKCCPLCKGWVRE